MKTDFMKRKCLQSNGRMKQMSRNNTVKEQQELNNTEKNEQEINSGNESKVSEEGKENKEIEEKESNENKIDQSVLDKKDEEISNLKDQLQRLAAEFDNYKKRTAKEKEKIYDASIVETVAAFLPVLDNIELALKAADNSNEKSIRDGVDMIYRQFKESLANLGVKCIEAVGEKFDPQLHEAVMHIEDEKYGDNEIVEEFRKGYVYKNGAVVRHSVVKVAN